MAPQRTVRQGYVVVYPNRGKAASKTTKVIVVILLVASVVLMLLVTIGGWSKLQGLKPINIIWCLLYLVIAYYVARWNRGLLPIAAALAILLLILAVIAGTGLPGTSWFDRDHFGFAAPQTMFGTKGLNPDVLGAITLIIAPVQLLLIVFAMQGFSQGWSVEQEVPEDEAKRRGGRRSAPPAEPATA
jgi:lysylphosphatidylglycerol synthetase-like protein (DUF2156 family)